MFDAVAVALAEARAQHRAGRYPETLQALSAAERALDDLAASEADPRRGELRLIAIARLRATGQLTDAIGEARRLVEDLARHGWGALEVEARTSLGECLRLQGDYVGALMMARQARTAAHTARDATGEMNALHLLGSALAGAGHIRKAAQAYTATETLARGLGQTYRLAKALADHAALLFEMGCPQDAEGLLEEALALARAEGAPFGVAKVLQTQAVLHRILGRFAESEANIRESLELARRVNTRFQQVWALNALGDLARWRGDLEGASAYYSEAGALLQQAGGNLHVTRLNFALLAFARQDFTTCADIAAEVGETARGGYRPIAAMLCFAASLAAGRLEDADRWEGRARLATTRYPAEIDVAQALQSAADLCERTPRATSRLLSLRARALALALPMRVALGQRAEEDQASAALRRLATQGAPVPLGPYDLLRPIGVGGMGEVWEGLHRSAGVPVAVKVLTLRATHEAEASAALRAEVRAVSRLNHPNILAIYDQRAMPLPASRMTGGRFREGSQALIMELGLGSLRGRCGRMAWPEVRGVLRDLLNALAHAHARGVIHRDLKPDNVLITRGGDAGSCFKLTDFGLATAATEQDTLQAGTPDYMAPEQVLGQTRQIGPWTDLYALGCLGWALLCGEPPFRGPTPAQVMARQIHEDPPTFEPCTPVPLGVETWLRRLLAKLPRHRYADAAEARRDLNALSEIAPDGPSRPRADRDTSAPTFYSAVLDLDEGLDEGIPTPPLPARAPVPPSWRDCTPPASGSVLFGRGVQAFGLREIPPVGRIQERDLLWGALVEGGCRLIVLRGAAGVGKSHLARWFSVLAEESGAALSLPLSGNLATSLAARLRWQGLRGLALEGAIAHTLGLVDDAQIRPITTWLTSNGERGHAAQTLESVGANRALVAVLDDAHAEPTVLEQLHALLVRPPALSLVVVICARDDQLAQAPAARRLLTRLMALPMAQTLQVPPLPDEDIGHLLRALLRLTPELAQLVASRASGNPQYAVTLVGDWVAREQLVQTEDGFALLDPADARMPDSLHEVWASRLAALTTGLPADASAGLELAAAQGLEVDQQLWADSAAEVGLILPPDLPDRLLDAALATLAPRGWAWSQALVRESLLRTAAEAHRLDRWHSALADVLLAQGGPPERVGHHLLLARRPAEAFAPLLEAASQRLAAGSGRAAWELVQASAEALDQMAVASDDPRHDHLAIARARASALLGG